MQHCDPEALSLLALGESPAASDVDEVHLVNCSACQSELDQLRAVVTIARGATADDVPAAPPAQVWDGIADQLGLADRSLPAEASADEARSADVVQLKPRRSAPWLAVAAAAVVGVLAGAVVVQAVDREPAPSIVASAVLEPLNEPAAEGVAELQLVGSDRQLAVDVSNLPPTDGFYEVWLLDEAADRLVSLGNLTSTDTGVFALPTDLDVAEFPVVDVSREPLDGNPAHSSDSVVRGTLSA